MIDSFGMKYDLKSVIEQACCVVPMPPVPTRWRRGMLALGSGDPTRDICSTRIAQAFQSVSHPIRRASRSRANLIARAANSPSGKFCTSITIAFSHRAISTFRRISKWSNQDRRQASTTVKLCGETQSRNEPAAASSGCGDSLLNEPARLVRRLAQGTGQLLGEQFQ